MLVALQTVARVAGAEVTPYRVVAEVLALGALLSFHAMSKGTFVQIWGFQKPEIGKGEMIWTSGFSPHDPRPETGSSQANDQTRKEVRPGHWATATLRWLRHW